MLQRLKNRPVSLWLAALIALVACGTAPTTQQAVCTDPASGVFIACPGANYCVDPLTGKPEACVSGDVSFGKPDVDAGSGDTKPGDVPTDSATDAATAELPPADTGPADTSAPPDTAIADAGPCQTGAKQCKDKATLQTCTNGVWGSNFTCAATQECNDGACGCPSPCKALGLVECLPDVAAIKTCQLNPDKCLSWGVPIACKPTEICSAGQCLPATASGCNPPCAANQTCQGTSCVPTSSGGTLTCSQVVACTGNCAAGDTACSAGCLAQGTSGAQGEFTSYKSCITAICKTIADSGKVNDAMACIFNNCFDVQAACLGAGSATCSATNTCISGCGNAASCVDACNKNASKSGGLAYYTLYGCIDANCGGQSGDALIDCAKTQCAGNFVSCFSPLPANQTLYSCLDIANCQGLCNNDALCAKACTAQATAQAQADANAFITCRDQKCGNWCPNGANCSACISQYCAYELAACSQ